MFCERDEANRSNQIDRTIQTLYSPQTTEPCYSTSLTALSDIANLAIATELYRPQDTGQD